MRKMEELTILQRLFLPRGKNASERSLYATGDKFIYTQGGIEVFPGGEIVFFTYFNAFNIKKYLEHTFINKILLDFGLSSGAGILTVLAHHRERTDILFEGAVSGATSLRFTRAELEGAELVYIKYSALERSSISHVNYSTDIFPVKKIHLAICVTTYNRPEQIGIVLGALHPFLSRNKGSHLFIINNGTIPLSADSEHVTIVPNRNTGGTGGFMRGLNEALAAGNYTHCLFMDDDANCHPESIDKAIKFLELCKNPRESVAGAMFYEGRPNIQYEAGATIEGFYPTPRNIDLDLAETTNVILNEQLSRPDYGPWWFFIFPIDAGLKYSFPFFVRGDDITFSLRNDFRPVMMNGICSWQESFDVKISPTVEYLAFRSFIMLSMVYKDGFDRARVSAHILHRLIKELFGLRYEYNLALQESIKDVLKGPAFWEENVLMEKRLQEIKRLALPHETREHVAGTWNGMIGKKGKILGLLTLGGHLVPSFLQRRTTLSRGRQAAPYGALRSSRIGYYSPETSTFEIFARNKALFFKCLLSSCQQVIKFYLAAPKSRNAYRDSLKKFESSEFWEAYFK